MANWEAWANKPFIITEFYTKGEDSGLLNDTGAGWLVKTQHDRGLFYENFIIKLLRSNGCVGWHWFRYQDNDPEDLTTDPSNRDSNKGLVKVNYDQYDDLMTICKTVNENVYSFLDYLKTNASDEEISFQPVADTYLRLLNTETTVHGKESLLRVKNSNGTTYERTAFLQFDFTPYINELSQIKRMQFGLRLLNVYPETNDPSSVTMTAYRLTNMPVNENTANNQMLTAYFGRNETVIGSVPIAVTTNSRDRFFEIDFTSLLSIISDNPILTIRLQMDKETATQFEFASRENSDSASRPYMKLFLKASESSDKQQQIESKINVYTNGNDLVVEGFEKDSLISLYNLSGQRISAKQNRSVNKVTFPICNSWGNFLLVNITNNEKTETIKILI